MKLLGNETYLGDDLYVSFDGFQLRLFTERGSDVHEVYLDPRVFESLLQFVANKLKVKIIVDGTEM